MSKKPTLLKKMHVEQFRNMHNLEIKFGKRLTVISGKNGTAKSTILGLVAQLFNFRKDYVNNEELSFKTISGDNFTSQFKEHFRISKQHDKPNSLKVRFEVYDSYLNCDLNELELTLNNYSDRVKPRAVARKNKITKHTNNTSRKVTHPIIYLSLKRLYPIPEREEGTRDIEYLQNNKAEYINLCNEIIGKTSGVSLTSTEGKVVSSSVVHGDNYDHESVSSGEDNIGQIVQAIFSFKKLKEDYNNYKGGILIIDEADAGLFPFAQKNLIKKLIKFSKDLNLQIILTTHSTLIIEQVYDRAKADQNGLFKNIFLTNSSGTLSIKNEYTWSNIFHDLLMEPIPTSKEMELPKINLYFEDAEARDFFKRLIYKGIFKKYIKLLDIKMGCKDYAKLAKLEIPEFSIRSILILDADVSFKNIQSYKSILLLPTTQPPDRLLFKFLYYLDANDKFWKNDRQFTKEVFENLTNVSIIVSRLGLNGTYEENFDTLVQNDLDDSSTNGLRELFKGFYNDAKLQLLINGSVKNNPFEYFLRLNKDIRINFQNEFIEVSKYILEKGHGVPKSKIETYFG